MLKNERLGCDGMWKTEMVLIAPEFGNDEGINVTAYHFNFFGLSICIQHKDCPLWRECDDERSARHREWKKKYDETHKMRV